MGFLLMMILWIALISSCATIDKTLMNFLYYKKVNIDVLLKDVGDNKTIIPWGWCILAICVWCLFFALHFKVSEFIAPIL